MIYYEDDTDIRTDYGVQIISKLASHLVCMYIGRREFFIFNYGTCLFEVGEACVSA